MCKARASESDTLRSQLTEARRDVDHWRRARQSALDAGELMLREIEGLKMQLAEERRKREEAEAQAAALREALTEALPYVPEYFRAKWDLDKPLSTDAGRSFLDRLARAERERDEALAVVFAGVKTLHELGNAELRARAEQAERERDEAVKALEASSKAAHDYALDVGAAEARCTRLEEALRAQVDIARTRLGRPLAPVEVMDEMYAVARAALQDSEKGAARDEGKE